MIALPLAGLSENQRRLVGENVGLVGVHLRRVVGGRSRSTHRRSRDDLFQEGCLGLIRAARTFDPACGIPFRAYALARIHSAVHQALITEGEIPRRTRRAKADPFHDPQSRLKRLPGVQTRRSERLPNDDIWMDRRGRSDAAGAPTLGDLMREKYERAVVGAAASLARRACGRRDRAVLVELLLRERFLVPDLSARRPLREIARETKSSFGRVVGTDRCIRTLVRGRLEADPEFRLLRRLRRDTASGAEHPLDEAIDRRLREASADEFLRRYRSADTVGRGAMLAAMLEFAEEDVPSWVRACFLRLSIEARERLLGAALDGDAVGTKSVKRSRLRRPREVCLGPQKPVQEP